MGQGCRHLKAWLGPETLFLNSLISLSAGGLSSSSWVPHDTGVASPEKGISEQARSISTSYDQVSEVTWWHFHFTLFFRSESLFHPYSRGSEGSIIEYCGHILKPPHYKKYSASALHKIQFISVAQSDSLWPHGLQHARPPCPTPTPRVYSNSCPLSRWCNPTISSSVVPFFSHLQSFLASGSFPVSRFFILGGQSIGVSALASVLPMSF